MRERGEEVRSIGRKEGRKEGEGEGEGNKLDTRSMRNKLVFKII